MRIFAISDLHLPGGQNKPMDIFGQSWSNHPQQIEEAWNKLVRAEDLVLIPGDISWAMTLEEAAKDFEFLQNLPGQKVIIRGNHDYWWPSISKLRSSLPANVFALQNDYFLLPDGTAVCGSRGWDIPSMQSTSHDEKIYNREVQRLQLSIAAAKRDGLTPIIAMLHYPPTDKVGQLTAITSVLESNCISKCVYGHLHGNESYAALSGVLRGVEYICVSCDALNFTPLYIHTIH